MRVQPYPAAPFIAIVILRTRLYTPSLHLGVEQMRGADMTDETVSHTQVAAGQLKAIVERIERLE
ncbi:MAG: hypothetical protein AAGF44_08065 [Pseudomonadota bacterium]